MYRLRVCTVFMCVPSVGVPVPACARLCCLRVFVPARARAYVSTRVCMSVSRCVTCRLMGERERECSGVPVTSFPSLDHARRSDNDKTFGYPESIAFEVSSRSLLSVDRWENHRECGVCRPHCLSDGTVPRSVGMAWHRPE